jgi:uncharacterized phiE125 gp8 family phage protein
MYGLQFPNNAIWLLPAGQLMPQIRWRLKLLSPPAVEPVTITDAKLLDKVEFNDEDPLWTRWVIGARKMIEDDTGRALITQTWCLYLDCFPAWDINLRRCPVQSIVSIDYVDTAGVPQTVPPENYDLDTASEPARLTPAWSKFWPFTRFQANAVQIAFTAGYGDAATDVPEFCRSPIESLAAWWNRHREQAGLKPPHYESLVAPLKWGDYQ